MPGFYNPFMQGPDIGGGFQDMFAKIMQMMMMRQLMGQQSQKQRPRQQPQMPPQNIPQYPTGAGGFSLGQNQLNPMQMGGQAGMGQQGQIDPMMLMQFLQMMMQGR